MARQNRVFVVGAGSLRKHLVNCFHLKFYDLATKLFFTTFPIPPKQFLDGQKTQKNMLLVLVFSWIGMLIASNWKTTFFSIATKKTPSVSAVPGAFFFGWIGVLIASNWKNTLFQHCKNKKHLQYLLGAALFLFSESVCTSRSLKKSNAMKHDKKNNTMCFCLVGPAFDVLLVSTWQALDRRSSVWIAFAARVSKDWHKT